MEVDSDTSSTDSLGIFSDEILLPSSIGSIGDSATGSTESLGDSATGSTESLEIDDGPTQVVQNQMSQHDYAASPTQENTPGAPIFTDRSDPPLLLNSQASTSHTDASQENEPTSPKKQSYQKSREDDDEGCICPICLDNWTNVGEHRVCSLRCGHLFCVKCLMHWFSVYKKTTCPTCKKKAWKSQIRYIYANKLIADDVTERKELKVQVDKARQEGNRLQIELTKVTGRQHLLMQQVEDLEKRLISENSLVNVQENGNIKLENSNSDKGILQLDKSLEICKNGGCRVLAYNQNLGLLVASMQSPFASRNYGVCKIDVSRYILTAFIPLHQTSIRDVHFHSENPWLLSVSLDKTIKITNTNMCETVSVYNNGDAPLWSCCWDANDTNMLFVGKQQGSIAKFDIRQMSEPISQIEIPGDMSPVVSVASVKVSPNDVLPRGGFIACKLNSLWAFSASETTPNEYDRYPLPIEGPFMSMSFQDRQLLVSTRSNARYPHSRHHLCTLETGNADNLLCNTIHCFNGSTKQTFLSRSCLIFNKSDTYVAEHQEANKSIALWSTRTGQKSIVIPGRDRVLDLCNVKVGNRNLLASLTDKKLEFFRFTD